MTKGLPETWDSGTRDPGIPGQWKWDREIWEPDTQDPGTGSLKLGTCDPETQNPESRTVRIELVTQIPSIPTRITD